jgi:hypothetical protein
MTICSLSLEVEEYEGNSRRKVATVSNPEYMFLLFPQVYNLQFILKQF